MVYILIPVVVVTGGAAAAVGASELFRAAGNAVSQAVHGPPPGGGDPYPRWVPFETRPAPSNGTALGAAAAAIALGGSMALQGRLVWGPAFAGMARQAAGDGGPIKTFGEFARRSGPGVARFGCNLTASTAVAGAVRPLVDGPRKG